MKRSAMPLLFGAALLAQGPIPSAPLLAVDKPQRPIDLAICLDISGSMNGLIDAARQNLWAVVNDLATLQPAPTLRVALLTFGCSAHDSERGWVKVETGFTSDLDLVSQRLFALTTNGGDEYVERVVRAALGELKWSDDAQALKLLFVAGNEAATQDPQLAAGSQSKAAIARGIVVNSIYCGDPNDAIAPAWRDVAKLADGQFAAIQQDNCVAISTPFDQQLAELSASLNPTYVPYGAQRQTWVDNQGAQDSNAVGLNAAAAAQRCQTKASALYCNAQWDLVDACADPKFKLEDVKKDELPEALRAMSIAQLREHVAVKTLERDAIKQSIAAVGKQRDAFLADELKKAGAEGDKRFERAVLEAVRQQAEARGFQRRVEAKPAAKDVDSPFTAVIRDAARDYRSFVRVTGDPHRAPTDCRIPAPHVKKSEADKEHGGKLYLLYARFADGLQYVKAGEPAKVGQTLVKEAWQCAAGQPQGATEASRRYLSSLILEQGGQVWHATDPAGLFVMHKLAADTTHTDQGWVYGAVDRDGVVTAAGRVQSCMRCHEGASEDRRFGLR